MLKRYTSWVLCGLIAVALGFAMVSTNADAANDRFKKVLERG